MGGGNTDQKTTTNNTTTTSTTIGDIGLTGANAVQLAGVLGQVQSNESQISSANYSNLLSTTNSLYLQMRQNERDFLTTVNNVETGKVPTFQATPEFKPDLNQAETTQTSGLSTNQLLLYVSFAAAAVFLLPKLLGKGK